MGRHEAPEPRTPLPRRLARHALHPAAHIIALVGLHIAALTVLGVAEKLSLLTGLLH
ncbi:hypothetical protein WEI85_19860 [Actinomycetes bacterium KLBMP 9797]